MKTSSPWRRVPSSLWIGIRVCGLLLVLRLMLPCLNLQTLLQWLTPSAPARSGRPQRLEQAVWWTDTLLRFVFPWQGKCLPRTLTLYAIATRSGYPVQVLCGIRQDDNKLQGHAWLSLYGMPFLEKNDPTLQYARVFSFPYTERNHSSERVTPTSSLHSSTSGFHL